MKIKTLAWILWILLAFVVGLYFGSILQQEHFIKGAYEIAEGLEGAEIEINIDLNETLMVDRFTKFIEEELIKQNTTAGGSQ